MAAPILPLISLPWIDKEGRPTIPFGTYMTLVAAGYLPQFTQLVDAANDAAAATAGVTVGQMYKTGSILKVRVT
jgi:hypothetical protein